MSYEDTKLPHEVSASFPNNLEAMLSVIKCDSRAFQDGLSALDKIQRDLVRSRLEAPGPGRPKETVEEFLEKISHAVYELGSEKPTQTAVATSLNCDSRNLRVRQKIHGFKKWCDVLTAILELHNEASQKRGTLIFKN